MKKNFKKLFCITMGVAMVLSLTMVNAQESSNIKRYSRNISGRNVNVVEVNMSKMSGYVALGQNKVGSVQSMSQIVKNNSAKAAVNGTFFNAYATAPEPQSPNGNLINKGKLIHKYDNGTTFAISKSGKAQIARRVKTSVNLTAHDTHHTVGAYGINRKVGAQGIYLFTDSWGNNLGIKNGINIAVDSNNIVVKKVSGENVGIPAGGFAINISGNSDSLLRFASACEVGKQVSWDYQVEGFEDNDIMTAVGAGPMVLSDSQKITSLENYKNEGFTEAKILTNAGARSAIGVKADGNVVIITTSAKVSELGGIMLSLGCRDAMNLDGGASSGLYSNGKFLTSPGRNLSNVLYFK